MNCANVIVSLLILLSGTLDQTIRKVMFQTKAKGITGKMELYNKAWFCSSLVFFSNASCMVLYLICVLYYRITSKHEKDIDVENPDKQSTEEEESEENSYKNKVVFLSKEDAFRNPIGSLGWKYPFVVILLAFLELLKTALNSIGLIFANASVILVLRGFLCFFTMFSTWIFMGRKPILRHVIGVSFAFVGLVFVGGSVIGWKNSIGKKVTFGSKSLLGIAIALCGQFVASIHFVLEEKLMKDVKVPVPPIFIIGSEGIAGIVISLGVVLQIINAIHGKDHGSYENLKNSYYMTFHSKLITTLQVITFFSIMVYNWSGIIHTKMKSATSRSLVAAMVTILVWIIMVILHYTTHHYGESVSYWTIMEIFGFVLMVTGTSIYNNIGQVGDKFIEFIKCQKEKKESESEQP